MSLRQQIKKRLHNLTPNFRLAASQKVKNKIITNNIFIHSKNIACYIPMDNEVDVWPIIETIWQQRKNCYLPLYDPSDIKNNKKTKKSLYFIKFQKYNTYNPKAYSIKFIAPQKIDLVIVPLLGFNKNRFRLGRGAGYYDRTFEFKQQNPKAKPYLLGVGYKWQQIEFKSNPWDVAMDEIIF